MSKKSLLCLVLIIMTSFILAGCGGVSEDDIKESIENKRANETAKLINSYAKQDDKKELDEAVAKDFKDLCKSTEYSDFEYMDKVVAKLKDKELKAILNDVIQRNGSNKVIAFIEGDWVRRDYTDLDGVAINVKSNKDDSVAIITDVRKSKDKDFKAGDVKWKNIKPMSSNEFVFEDLSKGSDDSHYEQGYANVEYDKNQINCRISASNKAYKKGNVQVWIKKEVIDEKKALLKKADIKDLGKIDKDSYEWWIDYNHNILPKRLSKQYKKEVSKLSEKKRQEVEKANKPFPIRGKVVYGDKYNKVVDIMV